MDLDTGELKLNVPNTVVTGRSVSKGVGLGSVVCLFGKKRQFFKSDIAPGAINAELLRLRHAVATAEGQLNSVIAELKNRGSQTEIFETHLLFLKDRTLLDEVERIIKEDKINSEWAVMMVIDEFSAQYKRLPVAHLREKYIDIEDVGERLVAALGGEEDIKIVLEPNSVIAADELNPSTLIEISGHQPSGIVTESGGWTSHAFILARELGIPAVTAIDNLLRRIDSGTQIIVDGDNGEIVIEPSQGVTSRIETARRGKTKAAIAAARESPDPETLDNVRIKICTNLDLIRKSDDVEYIKRFGVGLYRSEYLFKRFSSYPSEEVQLAKYIEILEVAGGSNVKIRTFDLNIGDFAGQIEKLDKNPALGLSGIRLSLRHETQFRVQIRALLRAGFEKNLDVVFPMVTDVGEFMRAKQLFESEAKSLATEKIPHRMPGLGVMIEIPAAVFAIDEILEAADFVNIGTNDLVQYLLAVDRDNDNVADLFNSLHPGFLRALQVVLRAANKAGKEAVVCGEMAGSPLYLPLLVGMGARVLSMNPASIERISKTVTKISTAQAGKIAGEVLKCRTASEVETSLLQHYREKFSHVEQIAANFRD